MDGLGRVNSAFSGFAGLEIPLVIQLLKYEGAVQLFVEQPLFFCSVCGLFHVEHLLSAVRSEAWHQRNC